MAEESAVKDCDLRAGRHLRALRLGKGYTPEQMGPLAGVGAATIRDIEKNGVIPHLGTQEKLSAFLGVEKSAIWRRPRRINPRRRTPSQRVTLALKLAARDPFAAAHRTDVDPFLYGVAWAVIRAQNPFMPNELVAQKAREAVDG